MLVRFALEPKAIDNTTTPAHIRRLLKQWERFGILVYPGRGDAVMSDRFRRLSPAARKTWTVALVVVAKGHRNFYRWLPYDGGAGTWQGLSTPESIALGEFEVALLDGSQAISLSIPEGENKLFGDVEGVRLCDIDGSQRFAQCERLSTDPIRTGERICDVWETRFRRLAMYSEDVAIVDGYAFSRGQIAGTLRFLKYLDRDSVRCEVTIYSVKRTGGSSPTEFSRKLRQQVGPVCGGGVKRVRVKLLRDDDFRRYAHDRHVRFDNNVFRIGRGVRVFSYERVEETTDVGLAVLRPGSKEHKESNLDACGTQTNDFCVWLNRR